MLIYNENDENNEKVKKVRELLKEAAKFNKEEELKYQRILFAEASV